VLGILLKVRLLPVCEWLGVLGERRIGGWGLGKECGKKVGKDAG
jgi:hypothetical protein